MKILLHNVLDWAARSNLGVNRDNLDSWASSIAAVFTEPTLILRRGVLFDNIFLYFNNISVSGNIEVYLYKFNNQYLNLLQYFKHRDMSSPSKQLSLPPVQNTNKSN